MRGGKERVMREKGETQTQTEEKEEEEGDEGKILANKESKSASQGNHKHRDTKEKKKSQFLIALMKQVSQGDRRKRSVFPDVSLRYDLTNCQ